MTTQANKTAYLVIWAGYSHEAIFTTKKAAQDYIQEQRKDPESWGVWRLEEVPLDPS